MTVIPLPKVRRRLGKIDKSMLALYEPVRMRCRAHLEWIRTLPCCVNGCRPSNVEAHHLRCVLVGCGQTSGDQWALPLCFDHHRGGIGVHAAGNEARWWAAQGIDPIALASRLWAIGERLRGRCQ